jgi:hypothetical protein
MRDSYNIRYGLQTGVIPNNQAYGLNTTETLLPQFLKEQGYATHAIGVRRRGWAELSSPRLLHGALLWWHQ